MNLSYNQLVLYEGPTNITSVWKNYPVATMGITKLLHFICICLQTVSWGFLFNLRDL